MIRSLSAGNLTGGFGGIIKCNIVKYKKRAKAFCVGYLKNAVIRENRGL